MKKILYLCIGILFLTGCGKEQEKKQKLENSTISCLHEEINEANTKEWGYDFYFDEYGEKLLSIKKRITIYLTEDTDDIEVASWILASNNICKDLETEAISCDVISTTTKIERIITLDMTKEVSSEEFSSALEIEKSDFENTNYTGLREILLNDKNYECD